MTTDFSVKSSEIQINVSQNYYWRIFLLCLASACLLFCFYWIIIENCICGYVRIPENFPFQCILINFGNFRPDYNFLESAGLSSWGFLWFFVWNLWNPERLQIFLLPYLWSKQLFSKSKWYHLELRKNGNLQLFNYFDTSFI